MNLGANRPHWWPEAHKSYKKFSPELEFLSYRCDIMSTEICEDRGKTAKTHELLLAGRSTGVTSAEFGW